MLDLLADALLLTFVVVFVRALPWSEPLKRKKPLACDACMVGWGLIAWKAERMAVYTWVGGAPPPLWTTVLTTGGIALLLLALYGYWKGSNFNPPEG